MLVGLPPYYAHSQVQLFENIKHGKLKFPKNLSIEVVLLLKGVNTFMINILFSHSF